MFAIFLVSVAFAARHYLVVSGFQAPPPFSAKKTGALPIYLEIHGSLL